MVQRSDTSATDTKDGRVIKPGPINTRRDAVSTNCVHVVEK